MGKNAIIFGVDMSSSVHIDNNKKDISILGEVPTQDDTTLRAEAQYSINFSRSSKKFCLPLHYNTRNNFLYNDPAKIYQFKVNDSNIKNYPLYLGNILKDFTAIHIKKAGLNGYVYEFYFDYNIIDTSNIVNIHKYLMKKHDIK